MGYGSKTNPNAAHSTNSNNDCYQILKLLKKLSSLSLIKIIFTMNMIKNVTASKKEKKTT